MFVTFGELKCLISTGILKVYKDELVLEKIRHLNYTTMM